MRRLRSFLERHILCRIDRKLIAASLIAILVPLLGTGLYGNWITSRILREQAVASIRLDLKQRASRIETYLAEVRRNVLYLARTPELTALLSARHTQDARAFASARQLLAQEFVAFASTHSVYYQIRYIDEFGQEIVRVNSRNGIVEVVPQERLQQKGHRYYFREAMRLKEGEIYMSPLDLNREFGQIEKPYTPVIRYATPVFYEDGSRAGIVIVNLFARQFLQYVSSLGQNQGYRALVDQEGYYLVHPNPSRLWGHPRDLGTGYRLNRDFPHQWSHILSPKPGMVKDEGYIVIHEPIFPNNENVEPYWVLIQAIPTQVLFASVHSFRVTAATILLMAVIAGVTMAAFLGRSITAPVLLLTEQVRRFGEGEPYQPVPVTTRDEVGELTHAFNEMARQIESDKERLERLTLWGQRIAAQLNHDHVLHTLLEAVHDLFPINYSVLRLTEQDGEVLLQQGDAQWAHLGHISQVRAIRQMVLTQHGWKGDSILLEDGRTVYLCCAFIDCRTHGTGVVELYGSDPALILPSFGNLLAALAVQTSIALENAHLYTTLAEHRARLQTLVERLINAQEEERRIVAYDIHDGLVQRLVGTRLQLMNLLDMESDWCPQTREALEKAITHLTTAIVEARRVIEGLRPGLLDDLGLVPALEFYAQELGNDAGWQIHINAPVTFPRLPPVVEVTAFRIVQEALNNIRKYAAAQHVWIDVHLTKDGVELLIRDDGRGFDLDDLEAQGHVFGIVGMQERAHLIGGRCEIYSTPGQGTTVRVFLPLGGAQHQNSDMSGLSTSPKGA